MTAKPYVIAAVAQAGPVDAQVEDVAQTQPAAAPVEDVALAQTTEAPAKDLALAQTTPVLDRRSENRRFHKYQIAILFVLALLAAVPLVLRRGRVERGSTTE